MTSENSPRVFLCRNEGILRLRGLHIYASAAFLPAVIYFLNAGYFVLLTAAAVLVHELGHFIALRLCGGDVKRLKVWFGGISMVYGGLGYAGETITALSGPGASVLLALASSLFGRIFLYTPAYHLAGLSLLLGIFNLLPVFPLDGGRVLFALSARFSGLPAAERVRKICSAVLICLAGLGGTLLLIVSGNPTLLIAAVCLAVCSARPGGNAAV